MQASFIGCNGSDIDSNTQPAVATGHCALMLEVVSLVITFSRLLSIAHSKDSFLQKIYKKMPSFAAAEKPLHLDERLWRE